MTELGWLKATEWHGNHGIFPCFSVFFRGKICLALVTHFLAMGDIVSSFLNEKWVLISKKVWTLWQLTDNGSLRIENWKLITFHFDNGYKHDKDNALALIKSMPILLFSKLAHQTNYQFPIVNWNRTTLCNNIIGIMLIRRKSGHQKQNQRSILQSHLTYSVKYPKSNAIRVRLRIWKRIGAKVI